MAKVKRKREFTESELIIESLGLAFTQRTASQEDIIDVLRKHHKQIQYLNKKVKQQEEVIQQLSGGTEVISIDNRQHPKKPRDKVLKCEDCGTISQYATGVRCPVCGSDSVTWTDPP